MPARRGRPPKSKKNSPIIDGAKFIKRFQPKLIYDQRGLLYQDLPIGCVRTLKGGRLYQEILREKNSQYYGGAEFIKIFFRGRPRRESMVCEMSMSNDPPDMLNYFLVIDRTCSANAEIGHIYRTHSAEL